MLRTSLRPLKYPECYQFEPLRTTSLYQQALSTSNWIIFSCNPTKFHLDQFFCPTWRYAFTCYSQAFAFNRTQNSFSEGFGLLLHIFFHFLRRFQSTCTTWVHKSILLMHSIVMSNSCVFLPNQKYMLGNWVDTESTCTELSNLVFILLLAFLETPYSHLCSIKSLKLITFLK